MKKLNVGVGENYKEGWINLDCRNNVRSDIKHDLNKFPYPFKDNMFGEILISHVLEHLNDPIMVLKEIIRISKNHTKIIIEVPHAYSYANVSDLQHQRNFVEHTFNLGHLKEYELENLELIKKEFVFNHKWKKYIPFKKLFNCLFDDIKFEFEVIKF